MPHYSSRLTSPELPYLLCINPVDGALITTVELPHTQRKKITCDRSCEIYLKIINWYFVYFDRQFLQIVNQTDSVLRVSYVRLRDIYKVFLCVLDSCTVLKYNSGLLFSFSTEECKHKWTSDAFQTKRNCHKGKSVEK